MSSTKIAAIAFDTPDSDVVSVDKIMRISKQRETRLEDHKEVGIDYLVLWLVDGSIFRVRDDNGIWHKFVRAVLEGAN